MPGTTLGGAKPTAAPGGKPEADMVTTSLYAPPTGGRNTLTFTDPPALTVNGVCGAAIVYADALVTVRFKGIDVEGAKPLLPEYTAVMLSVPATRLVQMSVAMPEALTVAVPNKVAPL